jgi:hypothetical protein
MLAVENPLDPFNMFFPKGQHVLNRSEWRGKEPRSCAVTGLRSGPQSQAGEKTTFEVEVSYRPKGHITYVGNTKYDGWTMLALDKTKDGTLLDGRGKPLPDDAPPVYLPFEVYEDVEFNDLNFGDFLEEVEVEGIRRVDYQDVLRWCRESTSVSATIRPAFVAARRNRPLAKIVLTEEAWQSGSESVGMRTIFVNKTAPHFRQTLFDQVYEVVAGFIEGRYSLKTLSTEAFEFISLSDSMMELKSKEGDPRRLESVLSVFSTYVTIEDMKELAERLEAVYEVHIAIVEGGEAGLLLKHASKKWEAE